MSNVNKNSSIQSINILLYPGFLVWLPAVIVVRYQHLNIKYTCGLPLGPNFLTIQTVLVYYLPIITMVYFYIRCLHGLHVQFTTISSITGKGPRHVSQNTDAAMPEDKPPAHLEVPVDDDTMDTNFTTNTTATVSSEHMPRGQPGHPYTTRSSHIARKRKEHVKIIRTLGIIMVTFLICWLPFTILWPIITYCPTCVPLRVMDYAVWSAYLNSLVNPTLYFLCNRDFRVALKHLVKKLCCQN